MTAEQRPSARGGHPAGVQQPRTVRTADGESVAYATYGDPEGTPVVVLHGTPGSRLLGELFDEAAEQRGLRVLAPDRPGYGQSTAAPVEPTETHRYVEPLLAEADASDAGIVGFSGGAAHVLGLAATRPGLVTSVDVVAGAVPPAVGSDPPASVRVAGALAGRAPRLLGGLVRAGTRLAALGPADAAASQYTTDGTDDLDDETVALVGRDFREALARTEGFVAESRLAVDGWGFDLGDVERPVRLFHGDRDANVPAEGARRSAERLPDAQLTALDGADHLRTLLRARSAVLDAHA